MDPWWSLISGVVFVFLGTDVFVSLRRYHENMAAAKRMYGVGSESVVYPIAMGIAALLFGWLWIFFAVKDSARGAGGAEAGTSFLPASGLSGGELWVLEMILLNAGSLLFWIGLSRFRRKRTAKVEGVVGITPGNRLLRVGSGVCLVVLGVLAAVTAVWPMVESVSNAGR